MIPIGRGFAAGFQITVQDGQLMVVAGSLWAQIERERADGPRYVEAVRGARDMRYVGWTRIASWSGDNRATWNELHNGCPEEWLIAPPVSR